MNNIQQQRGGTILGFIVGLIVGLVIAVVVAMVVTKTSIPFSSKQAKQGKISEPTASQTSDPNRPLYGSSSAAKEAVKDGDNGDKAAASKKETKPEDKTSDAPKKADAAKATAVKDAAAKEGAAKENAAKEAAAREAAQKSQAEDKWSYYLQTNAYRDAVEAESERAMLALTGFEARISETSSQGKPLYRVRLGPFSNIETMNRVRGKLTNSGINAAVVRTPK